MKVENLQELADYLECEINSNMDYSKLESYIKNEKITINETTDRITIEVRNDVNYFSTDKQPGRLVSFPRPTGRVFTKFLNLSGKGEGTALQEAICSTTGISNQSYEKMDMKDVLVLSQVFQLFL